MAENRQSVRRKRDVFVRTGAALVAAMCFAWAVYLLMESVEPQGGLVSFSFLLILPAALSAFVAFVADPWRDRSLKAYLMVPVWLLLAVIGASAFILMEGVICIVILSPLWLGSGLLGAWLTYKARPRRGQTIDSGVFCTAVLLVPLVAMQVEPMMPLPVTTPTVERSVIVGAKPGQIWPLLRGIPDVRPDEGQWNISQDVIGLPRPLGARLIGEGVGAERLANWGEQIRFRERIIDWQPEKAIGWRFIFDDLDGWRFTDRHLTPDSPYFRVADGGYKMERLDARRTRVTLTTRYWIRTPVNLYSQLWGELFLGDLENNLLALVKGRAENYPGPIPSPRT